MSAPNEPTLSKPTCQSFDSECAVETLSLEDFRGLLTGAKTPEEQERLINELCKVIR